MRRKGFEEEQQVFVVLGAGLATCAGVDADFDAVNVDVDVRRERESTPLLPNDLTAVAKRAAAFQYGPLSSIEQLIPGSIG